MKNLIIIFLLFISDTILSQNNISFKPSPISIVYKTIDTVTLNLHVYYPENHKKTDKVPAIVFFHGGGWAGGNFKQFNEQAGYFSKRGIIGITAEYRLSKKHNTTPFESVKDAKSAIRFLRINAQDLGIDQNKIIAGGGSAGGHLAAAAGNIIGLEEGGENLTISSKPNALVLFNPVFDNSKDGFGYSRFKERYKEISPMHNISKGAPPTIVFLGTSDKLISVETAKKYKRIMEGVGSRCDLHLYKNEQHGFFNKKKPINYKEDTLIKADLFLVSLNFLEAPSIVLNKKE